MKSIKYIAVGSVILAVAIYALTDSPREVESQPKAEPAKAYECQWATSKITLDGVADEPAWKAAKTIDNFDMPWLGKDKKPKQATKAKLLWDAEFLYFFAEMDDTDIFADKLKQDDQVWTNDVFELFFRPSVKHTGYYEFEVNAAGTHLDAFFPKYDLPKNGSQLFIGEFHMESKVKINGTLNKRDDVDKGWTVEGRIPWTDFLRTGGRPAYGESWQFALCRIDYQKDQPTEYSSTANFTEKKVGSFFHQSEDYTPIQFIGPKGATTQPYGIDKAPRVASSKVTGSPDPALPYRTKRAYEEFRPEFPIMARAIPGSDQMLLITQPKSYASTTVHRFKDDPNVKTADAVKQFDTPDSGTAYDIAFHPKFKDNGYVYFGWNGKQQGKIKTRFTHVTRYTMQTKPPYDIDLKTAKTIIEWESDGHNGGAVCFGKDGMMYVSSGDGTSDSDTDVMGQRTDTMLAKVMRIDVDNVEGDKGYSVPKDNPYVNDKRFVPETWAYGTRNPWRITSDLTTGQIWLGNNGQDLWETAHLVAKGDNFGWSVMEGSHPFYETRKAGPTPIVKPTIEHHHSEFRSLTGGIVYRGKEYPDLDGAYLYGDYSTGRVWGMKHDGQKVIWHKELAAPRILITGFTMNTRGQLLILDHAGKGEGGFYTFEPMPKDDKPNTFPRKLSESGLFANVKEHRMVEGVVPYSINAPFWSDGMYKERWIALPAGDPIEYKRTGGWNFPDQSVIVKSFAHESEEGNPATRKWIETRFLTKQGREWYGYTYRWNAEGTDADLIESKGRDEEFSYKSLKGDMKKQSWHYPSRAECMVCHSRAANFVLGLCSVQMNKTHDYGNVSDNQLRTLEHLGMLKVDLKSDSKEIWQDRAKAKGLEGKAAEDYVKEHSQQPNQRTAPPEVNAGNRPALVNPYDSSQNLNKRARSFLHVNCSSCHMQAGGGNSKIDLEYHADNAKTLMFNEAPVHHNFGLTDPKLVAPGKPDQSVLLKRVGLRGQYQMPPLSSNRVDEPGLAMLKEWIEKMKK